MTLRSKLSRFHWWPVAYEGRKEEKKIFQLCHRGVCGERQEFSDKSRAGKFKKKTGQNIKSLRICFAFAAPQFEPVIVSEKALKIVEDCRD